MLFLAFGENCYRKAALGAWAPRWPFRRTLVGKKSVNRTSEMPKPRSTALIALTAYQRQANGGLAEDWTRRAGGIEEGGGQRGVCPRLSLPRLRWRRSWSEPAPMMLTGS